MSFGQLVLAAAGLASMKAALEKGDLDEAQRQGVLAGPVVVEQGLASPDRATRMAAIAAAPFVEDRAELLAPLAVAAAGPDRRTAIPAARAARMIARDVARRPLPDDLAPEDVAEWRAAWATLAADPARWVELRVLALDTASLLAPDGAGLPLDAVLADPDPALRAAAIANLPVPIPAEHRVHLAKTVASDTDDRVALAAGAVLCADLAYDPPAPVLAALGEPGLARLRSIAGKHRDVVRCLRSARK
ncbi:MAG: hypothetical protein JNL83_01615 [Myxococcales bacterium]|nr:hypothetical protein [Myxococcales bacterium]